MREETSLRDTMDDIWGIMDDIWDISDNGISYERKNKIVAQKKLRALFISKDSWTRPRETWGARSKICQASCLRRGDGSCERQVGTSVLERATDDIASRSTSSDRRRT